MTDIVSTGRAAVFEVQGSKRCDCAVAIAWTPSDPLAINFEFYDGDNPTPVEWHIARDLLVMASKSNRLIGLGDFRARSDLRSFWLWITDGRQPPVVIEVPRGIVDFVIEESIREMPPYTLEELRAITAAIDEELPILMDGYL